MHKIAHKKYIQIAIIVIASISFALFFAEIIFRMCIQLNVIAYPKPDYGKIIYRYSKNKELIYELKPSFLSGNGRYGTNKYGMRDYEYSLNAPTNVVRICVLGDSVGYGPGLMLGQTFENVLEKKLNNDFANKFEILNFSVSGYNSYQEGIVLKEKVLKFNPEIVMVAFCLNDDSYTDGINELTREMSPNSAGSRLHSKLISYLLHRHGKRKFNQLDDVKKVEDFFKQLAILSEDRQLDVIIVIFPYYFETINSYKYVRKHISVNDIAEKNGLKTIDFMESWKNMGSGARKALYFPDGCHFSAIGMAKIADELFEYIVTTNTTMKLAELKTE